MCTKTSFPPVVGLINPNPFWELNHLTVPVAISKNSNQIRLDRRTRVSGAPTPIGPAAQPDVAQTWAEKPDRTGRRLLGRRARRFAQGGSRHGYWDKMRVEQPSAVLVAIFNVTVDPLVLFF